MAAVVVPDVELVCTHQDIIDEIGGPDAAQQSLPTGWADTKAIRTKALEETMESLYRRTPPIRLSDLDDVAELKRVVVYRALERLFRPAVTGPQDRWWLLYKEYKTKADDELDGLRPTIGGGLVGLGGWGVERR